MDFSTNVPLLYMYSVTATMNVLSTYCCTEYSQVLYTHIVLYLR